MKRILFAINLNPDKQIEEVILKKYQEITGETFEYESEYYLDGIVKELGQKRYDILVLRDDLEGTNTVSLDFLDEITDRFDIRIIFLSNTGEEGSSYLRGIFNLGIYDVLLKEDMDLDNLVALIQKGRTKIEAKIYLEIDDLIKNDKFLEENFQTIPEEQLEKILISLNKITEIQDFSSVFDEISRQYTDKQLLYLLSVLSDEIIAKFVESKNPTFFKIKDKWDKLNSNDEIEKNKKNKSFEFNFLKNINKPSKDEKPKEKVIVETKIITKIEKEYLYNLPSDYNKIVAFVGSGQTGTTTIIDYVAKYFSNNKKKVAVLDLTQNKTLYYMKCWGNDVEEEIKKGLQYLSKGVKYPIYVNEFYTIYTQIINMNEPFDFFNAIESLRYDNDVILIDMDLQTECSWLKYGVNALYLIQDLNIFNVLKTKKFLKKIGQEGVNFKKVHLIINKNVKCAVKSEDLYALLTEPIKHLELEYTNDINSFPINDTRFQIDFDTEHYPDILESYIYTMDRGIALKNIEEQIKVLCDHIYPLEKSNSAKKKSLFARIFG